MFTQNDLNLRKRRLLELFKNYKMSVLYHPGKGNVVAVKPKQHLYPLLMKLKKLDLNKSVNTFSEVKNGGIRN